MEIAFERKHRFAYLVSSVAVHTLGILHFALVIALRMYYDITKCEQTYYMKFGYGLKYVAVLNAVCQLLYNMLAAAVDIMALCSYTLDAPYSWLRVRWFFRSAVAIPNGMYTCTRFWMLSWLKLKIMGTNCYPNWFKHLLFSTNPIFLICDVISSSSEPTRTLFALVSINFTCAMYFVWLHIIYQYTGIWAVDFVKEFTLLERLICFTLTVLVEYVYFLIGRHFNDLLWSDEYVSQLPFFRAYVSHPSRFIYGRPSNDSSIFGKLLSRTTSIFVDRPKKEQQPSTQLNAIS